MSDLFVPGVSGRVNRYYICSERLRERGWEGVGDTWWMPGQEDTGLENSLTFAEALAVTGIGRFYAWEVQKFILERNLAEFKRKRKPQIDAINETLAELGRKLTDAFSDVESPTLMKRRVRE